jgi:hypothetical protein
MAHAAIASGVISDYPKITDTKPETYVPFTRKALESPLRGESFEVALA